jgi:hypothetical protein
MATHAGSRPFTGIDLRKMLLADGGWLRILLKIDENDAEQLGQLRALCGRKTGLRPVTRISLLSATSGFL